MTKNPFSAPKELVANKRFRAEIIERCETDLEFREVVKQKCKRDKIFLFDTFFWTYDPRLAQPIIPFILYPKQEALIKKLDVCLERSRNGEKINLLLDKPRAVGATFTVMDWCLAEWLFGDFTARVGSRKEDYVDKKGETDTLFYKLDFNIARLPSWMLPKGWADSYRNTMLLRNPESVNSISGESANPNFARGGRKSCVIFDEHGFWEWAKSSWESAGESTNLRITMSTPPESGRDSHFYKLLSGQLGRMEIFNFDWQDVPYRDAKWLEEQKATKSEEELAREVFKSYDSTTKGKVYAKDLGISKRSNVDYDPTLPLFVSWDFGLDAVAMIWWQKDFKNRKLYIIDSYWNSDKTIDFYVPFVNGVVESGVHEYNEYELEMIRRHANYSKTCTHFGDPDVRKRNLIDKTSTRDALEGRGIYVQCKEWGGRTWQDLRDKAKLVFRRLEINEDRNEYLISSIRNAKYPERRENSQTTSPITNPVHDWTSHFRTSFEYFADNEPDFDTRVTQEDLERIASEEKSYDKYDLF